MVAGLPFSIENVEMPGEYSHWQGRAGAWRRSEVGSKVWWRRWQISLGQSQFTLIFLLISFHFCYFFSFFFWWQWQLSPQSISIFTTFQLDFSHILVNSGKTEFISILSARSEFDAGLWNKTAIHKLIGTAMYQQYIILESNWKRSDWRSVCQIRRQLSLKLIWGETNQLAAT